MFTVGGDTTPIENVNHFKYLGQILEESDHTRWPCKEISVKANKNGEELEESYQTKKMPYCALLLWLSFTKQSCNLSYCMDPSTGY